MKLVHTAAHARRFVAFNDLAGDFLKMLGVAVLSGLFFSLVASLVVFLVASKAYAQPIAASAGLLRKLESPVLKDLVVRGPQGLKAETWPKRIPGLYSGEPIVVLAQVDRNIAPPYVSGMRGNEPWSMALTSPEQWVESGVGALWARHKIANLMAQARTGADPGKVQASVIEVALEQRLINKYTNMVALDVTPARPQHAVLKSSILPTNTPANWGQQGELAQTETSATQNLIAGSFALLPGTTLLLGERRRVVGVP
jgi:Ca-activated chloride channel family protein